jgi:hypothetical protein
MAGRHPSGRASQASPQAPTGLGHSVTIPDAAFQARVDEWVLECFPRLARDDKLERADRFIEEALELVQATGYSAERAHALVDYTFRRPAGEAFQEVGGVQTTLAALCNANGLDMAAAAEAELARVWTKIDKIRAKQAAKPTGSALPIASGMETGTAETVKQGSVAKP